MRPLRSCALRSRTFGATGPHWQPLAAGGPGAAQGQGPEEAAEHGPGRAGGALQNARVAGGPRKRRRLARGSKAGLPVFGPPAPSRARKRASTTASINTGSGGKRQKAGASASDAPGPDALPASLTDILRAFNVNCVDFFRSLRKFMMAASAPLNARVKIAAKGTAGTRSSRRNRSDADASTFAAAAHTAGEGKETERRVGEA